MKLRTRILLSAAAFAVTLGAFGENYPARPVRVIVPLSPGSLTDVITRVVATKMNASLGVPVVVEDLPGAGGVVGAVAGAKAAPDGYTLLVATSGSFSVNPHIHKNLAYDPVKDFAPVCRFGGGAYVLAVTPALGVKTLPELLAKAKVASLSFASSGLGSTPHMAQELFKSRVGVPFLHVPYKGAAQAITDVVAGHSQLLFETPGPLIPHIRSGKLIPIAIMAAHRLPALPEVPTFDELGYPGLRLQGWVGMVAPAGTPTAHVNLLATACQAALRSPEVAAQANPQGFVLEYAGPAEFGPFIATELQRYGQLVRQAGIQPE